MGDEDLKLKIILVNKEKSILGGTHLKLFKDEFHYINKDKIEFEYTFKKCQTFKEVKEIIQQTTKLLPEMMSFGKFSEYKNGSDWYVSVFYHDENTLRYSCYDQPYTEARYLYVIIDKNKSKTYNLLNTFAKEMEIKEEENKKKNEKLEWDNYSLNQELDSVKDEMENNKKENDEKIKKLKEDKKVFESEMINKMTLQEQDYKKKIKKMEDYHYKETQNLNNKILLTEENYKKSKKEVDELKIYSNQIKEENKIAQKKIVDEMNKLKEEKKKKKKKKYK